MSKFKPFQKINIIRQCTGFTATQKLILFVIASHLGNNEFCFLSLNTLQKETGLSRSTLADNINLLIKHEVLWKLLPSDGFKSNRYGINLDLLVVLHYQCSSLGLLGESPGTTRGVVSHYPKRNINKAKEKESKNPCNHSKEKAKKAKEEIRKICGLKIKD